MKAIKFVIPLIFITTIAQAKVNFSCGFLRKGSAMQAGPTVQLSVGREPVRVFQDANAYVEAELIHENNQMPLVRLYVTTKNENGMFIVRGAPQIATSIEQGLGISSIQCDSQNENFTLIIAMAKV